MAARVDPRSEKAEEGLLRLAYCAAAAAGIAGFGGLAQIPESGGDLLGDPAVGQRRHAL